MAYCLLFLFGKLIQYIVFGKLRDIEAKVNFFILYKKNE